MGTVYLAGPIAGLNYTGATRWRDDVHRELAKVGIRALSPMRGIGAPSLEAIYHQSGLDEAHVKAKHGPRELMTRDRFDATRCDVLFVNLLGATRVSIGTMMEIAWADLRRTPIVVAMEAEGNPHDHAMVNEAIGWRCETLGHAIHVTRNILA